MSAHYFYLFNVTVKCYVLSYSKCSFIKTLITPVWEIMQPITRVT